MARAEWATATPCGTAARWTCLGERWTKECGMGVHNAARVAYSCGGLALEDRINIPLRCPSSLTSCPPLHPSKPLSTHNSSHHNHPPRYRALMTLHNVRLSVDALRYAVAHPPHPAALHVCGHSAVPRTSEHRHYFFATDVPGLLTPQGRVKQRARSSRAGAVPRARWKTTRGRPVHAGQRVHAPFPDTSGGWNAG